MAVTTRGAHPEALWPGIQAWFGASYKELPQVWETIFDKRSSEKAYEKLVESNMFGYAPVKAEGAAISYGDPRQGYKQQITATAYALGYITTREEVADGQYKELSRKRSRGLARSLKATRELIHANHLNRATSGSYLGGDGVALLSTAHPTRDGNQTNRPTVAVDLNEASLEDMVILVQSMKDPMGLRIDVSAERLILPLQEQFNAARILKSTLQSGNNNNDVNALKVMGLLPKGMLSWRYLDDPDQWFIQTDVDDGLVHFEREEISLEQDNDFDTKNARASAYMRFGSGWGNWRCIAGSPGA